MAYNFVEQVHFAVPDISESLNSFKDGEFAESHGLIIEIAAIHEGLTQNFTDYRENQLEASLPSWTTPYPKPIIINHDITSDPLGRVMGAKMAREEDGTPYVKLQAAITNVGAIERVSDQRYLTGSVGGKVEEAICSICGTDFANESQTPCKHKRGKVYNGKIASLMMGGIEWREYSFVNTPADKRSGVKVGLQESTTDWTNTASFLVMDLNNQDVTQLTESNGNVDLLGNMRNKQAMPLYHGLKGSYLSVMAIEESLKENIDNIDTSDTNSSNDEVEIQLQENPMSKQVSEETQVDQEDDLLAAVESLENDAPAEEAEEADEVSEDTDSEPVEEGEQAEESEETEEEETAEEAEDTAEETEDAANEDVEPEAAEEETDSDDPFAEESQETEEDETSATEEAEAKEDSEEEEEVIEQDEQADDTELAEHQDSVEPPVEELKSLVESLKDENARLKAIVRRHLVEQVVDRKIEVGIVESEDRDTSIEEHMDRTASSLVDTLNDLKHMKTVTTETKGMPQIEMTSETLNERNARTEGEEEISDSESVEEKFEDLMVNTFMGRVKL